MNAHLVLAGPVRYGWVKYGLRDTIRRWKEEKPNGVAILVGPMKRGQVFWVHPSVTRMRHERTVYTLSPHQRYLFSFDYDGKDTSYDLAELIDMLIARVREYVMDISTRDVDVEFRCAANQRPGKLSVHLHFWVTTVWDGRSAMPDIVTFFAEDELGFWTHFKQWLGDDPLAEGVDLQAGFLRPNNWSFRMPWCPKTRDDFSLDFSAVLESDQEWWSPHPEVCPVDNHNTIAIRDVFDFPVLPPRVPTNTEAIYLPYPFPQEYNPCQLIVNKKYRLPLIVTNSKRCTHNPAKLHKGDKQLLKGSSVSCPDARCKHKGWRKVDFHMPTATGPTENIYVRYITPEAIEGLAQYLYDVHTAYSHQVLLDMGLDFGALLAPDPLALIIKSPMGSGKTRFVMKLMYETRYVGKKVLYIVMRRAQALDAYARMEYESAHHNSRREVICYLDREGKINQRWLDDSEDVKAIYIVSVNQLKKLETRIPVYDMVIVDEISSVMPTILYASTIAQKMTILRKLFVMCSAASLSVYMDAVITEGTRCTLEEMFRRYMEGTTMRFINNTPPQIPESDILFYDSVSEGVDAILEAAVLQHHVVVACSTKSLAIYLKDQVEQHGTVKLLIKGDDPQVDTWPQYNTVIFTPVITCGVDYTHPVDLAVTFAPSNTFGASVWDSFQQFGRCRNVTGRRIVSFCTISERPINYHHLSLTCTIDSFVCYMKGLPDFMGGFALPDDIESEEYRKAIRDIGFLYIERERTISRLLPPYMFFSALLRELNRPFVWVEGGAFLDRLILKEIGEVEQPPVQENEIEEATRLWKVTEETASDDKFVETCVGMGATDAWVNWLVAENLDTNDEWLHTTRNVSEQAVCYDPRKLVSLYYHLTSPTSTRREVCGLPEWDILERRGIQKPGLRGPWKKWKNKTLWDLYRMRVDDDGFVDQDQRNFLMRIYNDRRFVLNGLIQ